MIDLMFTPEFSMEYQDRKSKYLTKLENMILEYNAHLLEGKILVSEEIYNNCIELLNLIKPDSPILENNKEVVYIKELDEETLKYISDITKDEEILHFYLNPVGLNVKLVYEDGALVEATTFGRAFKNQDVLNFMYRVVDERNDNLNDLGHVEITGTVVLPNNNIGIAEEHCQIVNQYQGVFALIAYDESNDGILGNMDDFLVFIGTDIEIEGLPENKDIMQKLELLENYGFLTPDVFEVEKTEDINYDISMAMNTSDGEKELSEYMNDSFRLLLPRDEIILFRVGSYEIKTYSAVVKAIDWVDKKGEKVPKLLFEEPVVIDNWVEVDSMVLRSPNLLLILGIELGEPFKFSYFGDLGVLPVTNNNLIIIN